MINIDVSFKRLSSLAYILFWDNLLRLHGHLKIGHRPSQFKWGSFIKNLVYLLWPKSSQHCLQLFLCFLLPNSNPVSGGGSHLQNFPTLKSKFGLERKVLKLIISNLINWIWLLPFYSQSWQCHSVMLISPILSHSSFISFLGLVSLIRTSNRDHYLLGFISFYWSIIIY